MRINYLRAVWICAAVAVLTMRGVPVVRADDAPGSVQGSKWYMPETLDALRKIWTVVQKEQSDLKVIGESAFSSILLPACRETRHWGYVCDNTTPKTMRKADPKALFISSLEQFALAYEERERVRQITIPTAEIIQGDAREVMQSLPSCVIAHVTRLRMTGATN